MHTFWGVAETFSCDCVHSLHLFIIVFLFVVLSILSATVVVLATWLFVATVRLLLFFLFLSPSTHLLLFSWCLKFGSAHRRTLSLSTLLPPLYLGLLRARARLCDHGVGGLPSERLDAGAYHGAKQVALFRGGPRH